MKTTLLILSLLSGLAAQAQVRISRVALTGNGCAAQTADAAISPDRTELHVDWNQFLAEASQSAPSRRDEKICQVTVSMEFPQGYQVAIATDVEGFAHAPSTNSKATLTEDITWDGLRHPTVKKDFTRISNNFQMASDANLNSRSYWSRCGSTDALARIQLKLTAQGTAPTLLGLEHFSLRYQWKRCR